MRNAAGLTLTVASSFLAVVALLVNSPALFYMGTALVATIFASRAQAKWAVRDLAIERTVPERTEVGETISVTLEVKSARRFARPLVTIQDRIPKSMPHEIVRASIPLAPSFGQPIQIQYRIRPLRRGVFKWEEAQVWGSDALGLVLTDSKVHTNLSQLKVIPKPIPFELNLLYRVQAGFTDTRNRPLAGQGMDHRGIREYAPGDSLRSIHWKATARATKILVKEFDSPSSANALVLIQNHLGSNVGTREGFSLDLMCGHAAFLIGELVKSAEEVFLEQIQFDGPDLTIPMDYLAGISADGSSTLAEKLSQHLSQDKPFGHHFLFLLRMDHALVDLLSGDLGAASTLYIYNPSDFQPGRLATLDDAIHPENIRKLEQTGARVQIMTGWQEGIRAAV